MRIKVLTLLMFLVAMIAVGVIHAQVAIPGDDEAKVTSQALWGLPGYAAKYSTGGAPWTYEVGFQTLFGGRIVVGRGDSWQQAFDMAKAAIERGP